MRNIKKFIIIGFISAVVAIFLLFDAQKDFGKINIYSNGIVVGANGLYSVKLGKDKEAILDIDSKSYMDKGEEYIKNIEVSIDNKLIKNITYNDKIYNIINVKNFKINGEYYVIIDNGGSFGKMIGWILSYKNNKAELKRIAYDKYQSTFGIGNNGNKYYILTQEPFKSKELGTYYAYIPFTIKNGELVIENSEEYYTELKGYDFDSNFRNYTLDNTVLGYRTSNIKSKRDCIPAKSKIILLSFQVKDNKVNWIKCKKKNKLFYIKCNGESLQSNHVWH